MKRFHFLLTVITLITSAASFPALADRDDHRRGDDRRDRRHDRQHDRHDRHDHHYGPHKSSKVSIIVGSRPAYRPRYETVYYRNTVKPVYIPVQQPVYITNTTYLAQNTVSDADGEYCREFTRTIYVGGKTQSGYGTACMQPDGAWKILD